jgi:hypothetical protein
MRDLVWILGRLEVGEWEGKCVRTEKNCSLLRIQMNI